MVTIQETPVATLRGEPTTIADLADKRAVLLVNVASRCGLTPQYTVLEALHEKFAERGFTVIGVPCNQFGGQEPGSAAEIEEFCSTTYGVTFPMTAKMDVNGADRDPLYAQLTEAVDPSGYTGDIRWNFEKFVLSPDGEITARFAPKTAPDAPEVLAAIEAVLPS